ncbi:MAG TPA: (d)CMP kinase, partial [Fimbriimonadaceae bacterium]|nr:(d)CMP kinase [Fimbriimonadaceae bacterium]
MLIAVMGPTASGKSAVAEHVARDLDYQLINADALMVYRGLDIGTNKPQNKEDYELLDLVEPQEEFGVGEWVLRAVEVLNRLWSERRGAVIVGGTGFYVRA